MKNDKLGNKDVELIFNRLRDGEKLENISKELNYAKTTINKRLNKEGYYYHQDLEEWYDRNNTNELEKIKMKVKYKYIGEIDELGTDRYCGDFDEYIDTPWMTLEHVTMRTLLLDELEEIANEKCISISDLIEYMLLKQLNSTRYRDPEKINKQIRINDYKESDCDENEIKFLLQVEDFDNDFLDGYMFNPEEDLCIFWEVYLYKKGYSKEEIEKISNQNRMYEHYKLLTKGESDTFKQSEEILLNRKEYYEDENECYEDENESDNENEENCLVYNSLDFYLTPKLKSKDEMQEKAIQELKTYGYTGEQLNLLNENEVMEHYLFRGEGMGYDETKEFLINKDNERKKRELLYKENAIKVAENIIEDK